MTKQKNIQIYQDNKVTQARYEFTVIEKRIIYKIIEKVRNDFVLKENGQKTLFGNLVVTLTDSDLKILSNDDKTNAYESLRRLKTKFYEFDSEDEWLILSIYNEARHTKKSGIWKITVGEEMLKKFVELAERYTSYSLVVAMSLRSEHSQRFYEYCSQFKTAGGWQISLEELRFKLKMEKKYVRYAAFKKYVLDKAKDELKKLYDKKECDLYFNYSEVKEGRKVEYLKFKIIQRKDENKLELVDYDYYVRSKLYPLFDTEKKPKNKAFVDDAMTELRKQPENLQHCYEKLLFVEKNLPREEWSRYMRFVIKDEYLTK